ncbi:MAG: dehydrogenase E1 component subunit alpha/beta [Candidatus Tectimicrobiota bacterium]
MPGLKTALDLSTLYAQALLIRSVEERLLSLFTEGKLFGTVHTCIGQEWTGVAVAAALTEGDLLFSNHRGHGHYLAWTDDVEGLIAEVMGKQTGMCGGRGGSQHICARGFFSNGIQGGIVPVAAGLALAQQQQGVANMTVVFIGDGTLGEGVLYETLNIAAKWELPLLIVLENNLYAQSTAQEQTLAGDICARAAAFGMATAHSNTWSPEELLLSAATSVDKVRRTRQPCFLRIDTYRLMPHSKGDDDRDPQEVQRYRARDPLVLFLQESHPEDVAQLQARAQARIDSAVASAEAAPYTTASHSAALPPWEPLQWQRTRMPVCERFVHLLHGALERNMRQQERILLLGEDIEGPYGGAFKVTRSLSTTFPGRVRNTPISEAALVGLGTGLALSGWLPVCEIMFGDFLTLACDQWLNHAAKFRYMYNEQVRVPLIVRTPMGGKRGYGPTHSQSLEKHFLGVPDTRVLALHARYDPGLVYDTLFTTIDRPTLVIENKLLYGVRVSDQAPAGFVLEHTAELFPTTRLRPEAPPDVTILCYGGLVHEVERAVEQLFEEHEVICEVLCPLQLYPFNPCPLVESVQQSGRLLVVEEGGSFAAFGAEAMAQLMERAPGILRQVRRVAAPPHPIPSCGPLEKALLPGEQQVIEAVMRLMQHA